MALVEVGVFDIDAMLEARKSLTREANYAMAHQIDDLLLRMKRARYHEIATALVEEIEDRRGRLKVVDG